MEVFWMIGAAGVTILSVGIACCSRQREKRTLRRLEHMLEEAIKGDFREDAFDEGLLSAVEARLAEYLSASVVSERNLREEKEKIKTLIGDISHQTKTPLASVLLYTQLLEEQPLSAENRIYVDALEKQAQKLQFLIASLVKISQLETGILVLHPKENPVVPMLEKALEAMEGKARKKGIDLRLESEEATAIFDPKWTEEAVCNLIDNGIKYTPEGGAVTLRVVLYDMFCRIDVTDNGIGIEEEEQAKIFNRFYRGEAAAEQEGVGIGLYLVQQIAAEQKGYVKVSGREGGGAVFSLFLPMD